MKKIKFMPVVMLTAVTGLLASNSAYAGTLQLDSTQNNVDTINVTYMGNTVDAYVGGLTGNINGVNYTFFCYDMSHDINLGINYTSTVLTPTATNIASVAGSYNLSPVFNVQVATSLLNSINLASVNTKDQSAGLQMAIWSILYNWSSSSTPTTLAQAGSSYCTSGFCAQNADSTAIADAEAYLAQAVAYAKAFNTSLPNNGESYGNLFLSLNGSSSSPSQTLIGMSAPEPQSYILLGSCLSLAFCASYFRRATQKI